MSKITMASLINDMKFNPQSHLHFLEERGLAFENKEWWYLTLSGGLVTILGSLADMLQKWMQGYVFLAPLLGLIVTLTAWYVQLNYKKEYLANNMLKEEFLEIFNNHIEMNDDNHPFNYSKRGEMFRRKIRYKQALTHCMGKLSLFSIIVLFCIMMLANEIRL
ncbi:MAG: hypothetical protein AB7U85_06245 [Alphaproteobacteria bacterium]